MDSSPSKYTKKWNGFYMVPFGDRFSAGLIDVLLVAPIVSLLSFFIRKPIQEAFFLGNQFGFWFGIASVVSFSYLIFYIYRLSFYIFFKRTLGQMAFRIYVLKKESYSILKEMSLKDAFNRSFFEFLSYLSIVPLIEVFSRKDGRIFHDRLSDTIVVTSYVQKNSFYLPAHFLKIFSDFMSVQKQFVVLFGLLGMSTGLYYLIKENSFDLGHQVRAGNHCAVVSDIQRKWSDVGAKESRIEVALALYAAQAIELDCLKKEGIWALRLDEDNAEAALAMGLVYKDTSNFEIFLDKMCQLENSQACDVGLSVLDWPSHSLKLSGNNLSLYYKIWNVQQLYASGFWNKSLEVLNSISPKKEIAPFLNQFRVRSLALLGRMNEAKEAALVTYSHMSPDDRAYFGMWVCRESMRNSCDSFNNQCEVFKDQINNLDAPDVIAFDVLDRDCQGNTSEKKLSVIEKKLEDIFNAHKLGKFEKAYIDLSTFLSEHKFNSTHLIETRLKWIKNSSNSISLDVVFDDWMSEQKNYRWRVVGNALFKRYISVNNLGKAKQVSQELKNFYSSDWSPEQKYGGRVIATDLKDEIEAGK